MRIAIVSDIHGNRTAFESVLADLRLTAPDLILHGGDLADCGSSPVDVIDQIRDLGWQGVLGNTDEMLTTPETLEQFAEQQSPHLQPLFTALREMAAAAREALGEGRLAWLRALPRSYVQTPVGLVHASPESTWRAPAPDASDTKLESVYRPLGMPIAVHAHIHRAYVRRLTSITIANTGSVSLPYDGDRRAAYLLLDETIAVIRRVEYDVDREVRALAGSALPHADWVIRMLESATPLMP